MVSKNVWIIVLLFLFFPVGIFLMWKYSKWREAPKIIVSAFFGAMVVRSINDMLLALLFFLSVILVVAAGIASLIQRLRKKDTPIFKRIFFAALGFLISSFLIIIISPPISEPDISSEPVHKIENSSSQLADTEPTADELLAENEKILKEMEPKKQALESELYKVAVKENAASIGEIEVTVYSKDIFDVYIEIDIPQNDVEEAKKAVITLYDAFSNIDGYEVSSYTFVVTSNRSPVGMISKNNDSDEFSIIREGKKESFTAASSSVALTAQKFDVDWEKCIEDTKESVTGEHFDFVKDLYIEVKEEEKEIIFTAALADATAPEIALDYVDTLLRQFNLFASIQDSDVALGSKDYYGALYDQYDVRIGIAPLSATNDTSKWFVFDHLKAGMHTKHKIRLGKAYR